MQFQLPASNGYTLQVRTEGSSTAISLWRKDRNLQTTYYVGDSVDDSRIDANLGDQGRVDVQFQPSGEDEIFPVGYRSSRTGRCRRTGRVERELGTFVGTIEFAGEEGYATLSASQAPGSIGPAARPRCGAWATISSAPQPDLGRIVERVWIVPNVALMSRASSSSAIVDSTLLLASTEGDVAHIDAYQTEERSPDLYISRSAGATGPSSTFAVSRKLDRATIRPPAPFNGEARYLASRGRLVGDLTVDFPGLPGQPLAGPGFETKIRRVR